MKKRLGLAVIVLAATACFTAFFVTTRSDITAHSYQRIQVGMTRQQVEDILGGPARNESAKEPECITVVCCDMGPQIAWAVSRAKGEWWGPHIVIYLQFDTQDKVSSKKLERHEYGPAEKPSLWDECRSWLPW
jgi:hypothetical protein